MRRYAFFDQCLTTGSFPCCAEGGVKIFSLCGLSMPSVGTRRSTRVFVPKTAAKVSDSPVKLRSRKRVLLGSAGIRESVTGDEWIRLPRGASDAFSETESESPINKKRKKHSGSLKNDADKLVEDEFLVCWRQGNLPKLRSRLENGGDSAVVLSSGSCLKTLNLDVGRDDGGNMCADPDTERVAKNFTKFGITYSRKRRRSFASGNERLPMQPEDKMYGLSFTRKHRKTFCRNSRTISPLRANLEIPVNCLGEIARLAQEFSSDVGKVEKEFSPSFPDLWRKNSRHAILACIVTPSSNSCYFASFLFSVFRSIRKPGFTMYRFASFLFMESVAAVFSQHGIQFLPLLQSVELDTGLCAIEGERESKQGREDNLRPCVGVLGWRTTMLLMSHKIIAGEYLWSLKNQSLRRGEPGICAVFGALNSIPIMSLNFASLPTFFMLLHSNSMLFGSSYRLSRYIDLCLAQDSVDREDTVCSGTENFGGINKAPNSHSIGQVVSKFKSHQGRSRFPLPISSTRRTPLKDCLNELMNGNEKQAVLKSSIILRRGCERIKGIHVLLEGMNKKVDTLSCKANILMVDTDRCWREAGAQVMLKESESKEWVISVEHHGSMHFLHKPQEMRLCTSNRYTHAMMWTGQKGERGWKLEFCDRRDWVIFKELYKECCHRNALPMPSPAKLIPIPGVWEIIDYESTYCTAFIRPPDYVTDLDDELGRALVNDCLVYDMDSEDEEWLKQLDVKDRFSEINDCGRISEDLLEKAIDRLEKIAFRQPDDINDFGVIVGQCSDLLDVDEVEAIYNYWLCKRKQRGRALVRIFQRPPMKRAQLIEKPFLRKKRSFKRTRSRLEERRGKGQTLLEEVPYEASVRSVEEAQEDAKKALEAAILKRRRAQSLMQNADLATGKALMALRIAAGVAATGNSDILLLNG